MGDMLVGEFCLINVRRINPQGKEDKQMVMAKSFLVVSQGDDGLNCRHPSEL